MKGIPVLAFAAYSGTGKTTLVEKIIPLLKEKGLRVAVIKHTGAHPFEIDQKGKDSWRFRQAGADVIAINSTERTAFIEERPLSFEETVSLVRDVDLILVEGFREEPLTQIGIYREATGKGFTGALSRFIAVVTDVKLEASELDALELTQFGFHELQALTDFIVKNMEKFTKIYR